MARIGKLDLNQLNKQLERIDELHRRVSQLETDNAALKFQASQLDFIHARPTFNNLTFTWTGGTTTLSWTAGWLKDKNALSTEAGAFSQATSFQFNPSVPHGLTHNIPVQAGSLTLSASTYYWLGWDVNANVMLAFKDVASLYTHPNMQVICQIFTGTGAQSGTAGGGGSQGGTDLSGARYKLF